MRKYAGFALIIIVAFALRLWGLDTRSLWFDEGVEYWAAAAPFWDLPHTVISQLQPPLFTYLLHFWLFFGMGSVWLRLLPVALSLFAVLGGMFWARRLAGERAALIAGALLALMPVHVRYAQDVGEYTLLLATLTWSLAWLDDALATGRWRSWFLWGAFSIAAVYSQYGAALVIGPLALLVFLRSLWLREPQAVRRQAALAAAGLLAGVPLVVRLLPTQMRNANQAAFRPVFTSWGAELAHFPQAMVSTLLYLLTYAPDLDLPPVAGLLLVAAIAGLFLTAVLRRRGAAAPRRLIVWFVVAFLVYFAAVRAGLYGYGIYGERYALILAPLFAMALAAAIEQLWRWRLAPLALAALVLLLAAEGASLPQLHQTQLAGRDDTGEDMRPVFAYWQQNLEAGTPTYVYYGAAPVFRYYYRLAGLEPGPLPATWYAACWRGESLPTCSAAGIFYGTWFRNRSPAEMAASIRQTLPADTPRFWIIFSHAENKEDSVILQELFRHYMVVDFYRQGLSSAYLMQSY